MHEFTTDIARLRISLGAAGLCLRSSAGFVREFAERPAREPLLLDCLRRTFAEALVAAGSVMLDIDSSEIGVTFHAADQQALGKEVILFDTAPGGAGYAQQLAGQVRRLFSQAADILSGCHCGDSCYACLRSYHNQLHHRRLNRHLLDEGLRRFNSENWS